MILVTGAGGKTGRALIKVLSEHESIRAFVRSAQQVATVKALGAAEVIVGDLRDESALGDAMQGARAVYHICPNMSPDESAIGKLVIEQARAAAVEHFVFHSVLHPQIEQMPHHWDKLRVEELLFESGLRFTILQPAPYMQNLLSGWTKILEEGVLEVPYAIETRLSLVDLEDVAAAAAKVLIDPGHHHATYELAGTLPLSQSEVAEALSRALKRAVRAEREDIGAWKNRAERSSAGAQSKRESETNPYAVEALGKMFDYYNQFGLTGNPNTLRWLLGREPVTLERFIERAFKEYDALR